MTEKTAQPDASQGRARWLVASVAFAAFLCMLNTHTINIALPVIAQHFQVDTGMVARVTLAYLMTMTCLLLVFGKLDDQLGLKRLFISGYGLFTAGSLLSGIAPSLGILILGRAVQGIGASMLLQPAQPSLQGMCPRTAGAGGSESRALFPRPAPCSARRLAA